MQGLMQDHRLTIPSILDYGAGVYGEVEVVSRTIEGPIHRYGYGDCARRARRFAQALAKLGVAPGDRVGGVSWNHYRYLETFYGVAGIGAVLHTINPRLFSEQLAFTVDHAGDRFIIADAACLPIFEAIADQLTHVEGYIVLAAADEMPETTLANVHCYEQLIDAADGDFEWAQLDEWAASALCYTSGTTGDPKGVLYSHRSSVLNAYAFNSPNGVGVSFRDVLMPIVPFFHGNGWGVPFAAPMAGAKLVLPGRGMEMDKLHDLIVGEGVSIGLGVPTVWLSMLEYLRATGAGLGGLERIVTGGSAPPRAMIERLEADYGVTTSHAWGMTETSAATTYSHPPASAERAAALDVRVTQGRPVYGAEIRITGEAGQALPWDGASAGELKARGYWIAREYYRLPDAPALDDEGWLVTGDIGVIGADGNLRLTDRAKDVIKSGGEWISSIDLENAAVGHPEVLGAAVIAVPHEKWQERPLLIVVRQPGSEIGGQAIIDWLADRVAKWWLPEEVVFVDQIPHTGTGKIDKVALRARFADRRPGLATGEHDAAE